MFGCLLSLGGQVLSEGKQSRRGSGGVRRESVVGMGCMREESTLNWKEKICKRRSQPEISVIGGNRGWLLSYSPWLWRSWHCMHVYCRFKDGDIVLVWNSLPSWQRERTKAKCLDVAVRLLLKRAHFDSAHNSLAKENYPIAYRWGDAQSSPKVRNGQYWVINIVRPTVHSLHGCTVSSLAFIT